MSKEKANRPKYPELSIPYSGVTKEIFTELLINRDEFVRETFETMEVENPRLARMLVSEGISSMQPDTTFNWALAYYAIYSRSAKRKGEPMIVVTEDRFRSLRSEELALLSQAESFGEDEQIADFFNNQSNKIDSLIGKEIKKSKELAEYWACLKRFQASSLMAGKTPSEIEFVLEAANSLVCLLHSQEKTNILTVKFNEE